MIDIDFDYSNLPNHPGLAFLEYEKRVRATISTHFEFDRHLGNRRSAASSDRPLRLYVTAIISFIRVYGLRGLDVMDISEAPSDKFQHHFHIFRNRVQAFRMECSLKMERTEQTMQGTPLNLSDDFREVIGKQLEVIRKIVRQEIKDSNKRDAILSKIASLQSEIDQSQTTIDHFFGRLIDFSRVIKECGDNILPLLERVERIVCLPTQRPEYLITQATIKAAKTLPQLKNREQSHDEEPPAQVVQ